MTLEQEPTIRLAGFAIMFAVMALWEVLAPRRRLTTNKPLRWLHHFSLVGLNNLLVRFVMPITAIESALLAREQGWGLFHAVHLPLAAEIVLSVLILDLMIYVQHVVFHLVPVFWRLHRVHHFDLDLDVTSGVRFHTVEILLSMFIKCAAVMALGSSAWAVLTFEVLLNATSMFNHSNVWMPPWLDKLLRWFVVTPDMHRVHHSVIRAETDSNFGFNLPWWDYCFRTYRDQPQAGHDQMAIGLPEERSESRCERLGWLLISPFLQLEVVEGEQATASADTPPDHPSSA